MNDEYIWVPTKLGDRPWQPSDLKEGIPFGFKKIKKSDLPKYFQELSKNG